MTIGPADSAENNNKRIALFIDSLAGGGAEKVVITLANAFSQLGHRAEIICLQQRQEYAVPEHIPVHYLYPQRRVKLASPWSRAKHAKELTALITKLQLNDSAFDLFLANLDETNYIVSACHFSPCYYIVHNAIMPTLARAKLMGPHKYLRQRRLFKALEQRRIIAVSQALAQEVEQQNLFTAESTSAIYNPFDLTAIRAASEEKCSKLPSFPYILHIGRFAKQKRHDVLFSAIKRLSDTSLKLVCLVSNTAGLQRLVQRLGVADRVVVVEFQQNPYVWIKQAKCLVLSSDFEGFGNVLVESLACGTPVVATDCPYGPNEILVGENRTFLVPPNDPEKLAQAITRRLETPINDNIQRLSATFGHIQIAKQYLALLQSPPAPGSQD
ncbi:glycosyltransferase [Alteromonas flava]|uniref:glycosyltransferase n=1 Tax=Alteromonas flava TaxID=2048003 RepID=UPI000C292CDB|nr:glycosyltransferase [Alteromonas flava]